VCFIVSKTTSKLERVILTTLYLAGEKTINKFLDVPLFIFVFKFLDDVLFILFGFRFMYDYLILHLFTFLYVVLFIFIS
jgi:hypothetical protein